MTFNRTMDDHSVRVHENHHFVGSLNWHPEREARFLPALSWVTMSQMHEIVDWYQENVLKPRQPPGQTNAPG